MASNKSPIVTIIRALVLFSRNVFGSVHSPYKTYRALSKGENLLQAVPIYIACIVYFWWSSLVHHGVSAHPYLLTVSFGTLVAAAGITLALVTASIVLVGRLVGGSGKLKNVFLPWSYSLLPTLIWFFTTSAMALFLPPPRTTSILGQLFSFLFLSFSLFLFFWKGILYYLTLRFSMKLDMGKIMLASIILFPLGALYAVFMYNLGIFRIPFI